MASPFEICAVCTKIFDGSVYDELCSKKCADKFVEEHGVALVKCESCGKKYPSVKDHQCQPVK